MSNRRPATFSLRAQTALAWSIVAAATGCAGSVSELGPGGDAGLETALARIDPRIVRGHMMFLSHDLLRGRDTGDVGYEIAREYVAGQFARMGLQPIDGASYLQPFDILEAGEDHGSSLEVGGLLLKGSDAIFTPDWLDERPEIAGEGIFAGYGLPVDGRQDYGGLDVEGKIVFLVAGWPEGWEADPDRAHLTRLKTEIAHRLGAVAVVELQRRAATPESLAAWEATRNRRRPLRVLADGTAASLRADVVVGPAATERVWGEWGLSREELLQQAEIGVAARALGAVTITRERVVNRGRSWNVMGVVGGSDPEVSGEIVMITSHLDHVGIGEPDESGDRIYNGTHDNALGTAKMLAAAEAMAMLSPRRSVGFIAVGAEEGGLLGSWYYVRHPVFAIENTVAVINHDGGLSGAATDDVQAFGAELSTALEERLDRAAEAAGMFLEREHRAPFGPAQMLLFRSDQYSFILAGVPGLYLMPGFTIAGDPERGRDMWVRYLDNVNHRQRDNFDPAWSLESPANMAALSVRLAWDLANGDGMPRMDADAPVSQTRRSPDQPYFFGDTLPVGR